MKIVVIDNGGQYAHRIYRNFQDLDVDVDILPNSTPVDEIMADGLAFSGSGGSIGTKEESPMGNCGEYLDNFKGPILAMCAGHQLTATHFGGKVGPATVPEFGKTEVFVDKAEGILKGVPAESESNSMVVWNSHNDEVSELSEKLEVLAHSKDCPFEVIKHKTKPIWGVQFHPEVQHTEYGEQIFENFVEIVKEFVEKKEEVAVSPA